MSESMTPSTPDTHKKPWANATPAGLVALAVACFCFFASLMGFVNKTADSNAMILMGAWLLGGFVVQIIVAITDLKAGNKTGGNTFLYFSAFFMLVAGLEMIFKVIFPHLDTRIDGWAWIVLTLVVWMWSPAFLKSPLLLFLIVVFLGLALPFIFLMDLKLFDAGFSAVAAPIAGISLLIAGLLGIYLSAAMVVNKAFGRKVFANPGPILKS
jgi:uncharacterized protein